MAHDTDAIANAVWGTLQSPNEVDSNLEAANVVDALYVIGRGIHRLATAVETLGVNDAATSMGAIEVLAKEVRAVAEALGAEAYD